MPAMPSGLAPDCTGGCGRAARQDQELAAPSVDFSRVGPPRRNGPPGWPHRPDDRRLGDPPNRWLHALQAGAHDAARAGIASAKPAVISLAT